MTATLTVLGALGVLRRCRTRHETFRWIRCELGYGHSGRQHRFGWVDVAGVPCNLDKPAGSPAQLPTALGSYTVNVTAARIGDGAFSPTSGTVELSLESSGKPVQYNEYLMPRRRRWRWWR